MRAYGDPSHVGIPVTGLLDDDTALFYVLPEFDDVEDGSGCDIILRFLFPAAAPQVLFGEHAQHLAVEFRSFITEAYERFNGPNLAHAALFRDKNSSITKFIIGIKSELAGH